MPNQIRQFDYIMINSIGFSKGKQQSFSLECKSINKLIYLIRAVCEFNVQYESNDYEIGLTFRKIEMINWQQSNLLPSIIFS